MTRDELRQRARTAWRRLRGGELTPARAGLSVAVGLCIGATPLYGFHIFLVLGVCLALGLDAPVSYLAANVSIPPLAPFLALAEIEIGAWLLSERGLTVNLAELRATGAATFARELAYGTFVFAPALGVAGGSLAYVLVAAARRAPPGEFEGVVARVAERFADGRRSAYYYVRGKLLGDPVVRRIWEIAAHAPLGVVADVGCGRGQLSVTLLEAKGATETVGFDWDQRKVADAARAAAGLRASFEVGDLRSHPIPSCDTAILIDVLHYLPAADQDALLERCAAAAKHAVLIRDLDPDRGWRSALTRAQEYVTTNLRYNRGGRLEVRPIRAIVDVLGPMGFEVSIEPCWQGTPFANVLVVARRVHAEASIASENDAAAPNTSAK